MNISDQLKKTADHLIKIRPSYGPILNFYSRVFQAQQQSKEQINLSPIHIEADLLKAKEQNDMPLIDPSEFLIDHNSAKRLLGVVCDLASAHAPNLSTGIPSLKSALEDSPDLIESLFYAILTNRDSELTELGNKLNMKVNELVYFGFTSMVPSIQVCAEQLNSYLTEKPDVKKGYCPVCGNQPDMAFLDQDGNRHLKCCFCSHKWQIKRMGCVFCENTDAEQQNYFYSEDEKEYRVNLCDHCHSYIKMVDLRHMDRAFHPNLELVSTLHLDMKAREKGYMNPASPDLETHDE